MKTFFTFLICCAGVVNVFARESTIAEAEKNPASTVSLVLHGMDNDAARLVKLSSQLTSLNRVVLESVSNANAAMELVASTAACNTVKTIVFRRCTLDQLPSNLQMLTQVVSFSSEDCVIADNEQFYHAIAGMSSVNNVHVAGSGFRNLPTSFTRMRVMKNVSLENRDIQLATGYDLNTKLPSELVVSDTVKFGFGEDILNLSYSCYNQQACAAHLQMFRDVLQGAPILSNVFYVPLRAQAYLPVHPLVKPPLQNVDVAPDVFTTSALTGTQFEYGSGTIVTIPPMAFVDAQGNPVQGEVAVSYREFRDPVDILVSGIPMKYDSAGTTGDFESAGMFEMYASVNGQEVFLAEGKSVAVDFAVTDTASTYNFYRLDEEKGWQYESDPGVPERLGTSRGFSGAIQYFLGNLAPAGWSGYRLNDTISFEGMFADTSYDYDRKYKRSKYDRKRRAEKNRKLAFSNLYFTRVTSSKKHTCIKVKRNYMRGHHNPEFYTYGGYSWKITPALKSRGFNKKYGPEAGLCDIRVIRDGDSYFLELKTARGHEMLAAEPVWINRKGEAVSLNDAVKERLWKRYTRSLDRRTMRHDVKATKERVRVIQHANDLRNDSLTAWTNARRFMSADESAKSYGEWVAYCEPFKDSMESTRSDMYQQSSAVRQALTVMDFGVYNCDQIQRIQAPAEIFAGTTIFDSTYSLVSTVYVINKKRNMSFTYSSPEGGAVAMTYGRNDQTTLLLIDPVGAVYVVNEEQFKKGVKGEQRVKEFESTPAPGGLTTTETLRRLIYPERYVN